MICFERVSIIKIQEKQIFAKFWSVWIANLFQYMVGWSTKNFLDIGKKSYEVKDLKNQTLVEKTNLLIDF